VLRDRKEADEIQLNGHSKLIALTDGQPTSPMRTNETELCVVKTELDCMQDEWAAEWYKMLSAYAAHKRRVSLRTPATKQKLRCTDNQV
jgi:hypothetical protein